MRKYYKYLLTFLVVFSFSVFAININALDYEATAEDINLGTASVGYDKDNYVGHPVITNTGTNTLYLTSAYSKIVLTGEGAENFESGWNSGGGSVGTGEVINKGWIKPKDGLPVGEYSCGYSFQYSENGNDSWEEFDSATVSFKVTNESTSRVQIIMNENVGNNYGTFTVSGGNFDNTIEHNSSVAEFVDIGTNITLTATANSTHNFIGWYNAEEYDISGSANLGIMSWRAVGNALTTNNTYTFNVSNDYYNILPMFESKAGHNNIWATSGGQIAVLYENREEEQTDLDGEHWVNNGMVVDYLKGDSITVKAKANEGFHFVGWFQSDPNASVAENYVREPVLSTNTSYTYMPGVTTVSGVDEPINYITAAFEEDSSEDPSTPNFTSSTTIVKTDTENEVKPYGTDLVAYINEKKQEYIDSASANNTEPKPEWLELYVNTGGVYKYPKYTATVFTGVTYPDDPDCTGITCDGDAIFHYEERYTEVIVTASTTVTVTFDPKDGSEPYEVEVTGGTPVSEPTEPQREGYNFGAWSLNEQILNENTSEIEEGKDFYDFSTPVIEPITLVGNWQKYHTVKFVTNITLPDELKPVDQQVLGGFPPVMPKDSSGNNVVGEYDGYALTSFFLDSTYNVVYSGESISANTTIYLYYRDVYNDFNNKIDNVEISYTKPTSGTEVTMSDISDPDTQEPQLEVKVPDGVNYKLWDDGQNYSNYSLSSSFDGEPYVGILEKGKTYYAQVWLITTNAFDYVFDRNVKVKVNGKQVSASTYMVDFNIIEVVIPINLGSYNIIKGDNQSIDPDNPTDLVVVADGNYSDVDHLEIDGNRLEETDASIEEGSTIVTVSSTYLKKLSNGNHTLSIVYSDGRVTAKFSKGNNPKTIDNIYLYVLAFIVSLGGLIFGIFKFKKTIKK